MPSVDDLFTVITPVDGDGPFGLVSFSGTEGLSRLFEFRLELASGNTALQPKDLVGQGITFGITPGSGSGYRYFHGIVRRLVVGGLLGKARSYAVALVPSLWLLTRSADCRIFQNLSAVEIIEQKFQDFGISSYELKLQGTYPKRQY